MIRAGAGVSVGNLTAFLGLDDSHFVRGMARATSSMAGMRATMRSIGSTMSTFVTLPLLALGGAAIKSAMDFEKVFSEIEGQVGIAKDQVLAFKQEILDMSRATGQGPQQLSEALRYVTSSGFATGGALQITNQAARAAAAGFGNVKDIADLTTSAINAYGKENLTAAQVTDTLAAAVREGKAEGTDLAHSFGFVIPLASEMGVSFQQASAAIAAMTRVMRGGADGASTAGTNLRQMLSDIKDPSAKAEAALQKIGMTSRELEHALVGGKGVKGLLSALQKLKDSGPDIFEDIFPNVRALTGSLQLVGKNAEEVRQVFANMVDNTGDMDKAFQVASHTASFKFNKSLAELKIAGIELGTQLMPIFLDFMSLIRDVAAWFNSLGEEGKRLTVIIMSLGAVVGPLMLVLSSIGAVLAAISGTVLLVVAGIAALASGFIYLAGNWDAVKERMSDVTWWRNMLIDMLNALIQYNPVSLLIKSLQKAYEWLRKQPGGSVIPPMPDLFEIVTEGLDMLKGETKEYQHQFKGFAQTMIDEAKRAGAALMNLFPKTGGGGGWEGAPGVAPNQQARPEQFTASFTPTLSPILGVIDEKMLGMLKRARTQAELLAESFETTLTNAVMTFATTLGDAFAALATGEQSFLEVMAKGTQAIIEMFLQRSIAAMISAHMTDPTTAAFPWAKLALATAGIVAVRALFGQVQGLASGGYVTEGGVFQLHKDELVTLPSGSAVTPAHLAMGGGGGTLTTGIDLRKLIIELDRERQRMGR